MQSQFYVENQHTETVIEAIKKYTSIRFDQNPMNYGKETFFSLIGDVSDFNKLNHDLLEFYSFI